MNTKLLPFLIASLFTQVSYAAPKSASIESVIDKLERKLVQENRNRMTMYSATSKTTVTQKN